MDLNYQNLTAEIYNLTNRIDNFTRIKKCIEWHGNEQVSFQLSNFLFFIAFLTPHNVSNQICDLLFRLLITMGCSIKIIWIISIKEHCFFNFIIFFWTIFLFINFLHSFHLTYKLSPASLPKKFNKLFKSVFEPVKMTKKEFKILIQHSLIINLNKGENYLIENQSPIDEKVAILLEGRLDVTHENVHLHQIYPNDFIDSPEFKFIEFYSKEKLAAQQQTYSLTTFDSTNEDSRTCSNCKQILIEIDNDNSLMNREITTQPQKNLVIPKKNEILKRNNFSAKKSSACKNSFRTVHPARHQKICISEKQKIDNQSIRDIANILSIESPEKDKFKNCTVNKLAQGCLLVEDTLANNLKLRTIFNNLIGKDIIHKLYLVNEEQRMKAQQQLIGDTQNDSISLKNQSQLPNKLLAHHNPLKGDNLYTYPYIPHDSMMYLGGQYNCNLNIGLTGLINQQLLQQPNLIPNFNPYLNYYPFFNDQAIINTNRSNIDQQKQQKPKSSN